MPVEQSGGAEVSTEPREMSGGGENGVVRNVTRRGRKRILGNQRGNGVAGGREGVAESKAGFDTFHDEGGGLRVRAVFPFRYTVRKSIWR